jgi:S-formylglutathione hydrolase FrmB
MPDANTGRIGYSNDIKGEWPYEDFFFQEFIPYIEKTYRIKADKKYRAIAGNSMGGGGAFTYALHHPELFVAACPLSAGTGPLTLEDAKSQLIRDDPNMPDSLIKMYYSRQSVLELINNIPDDQKNAVRWYIDCGDDDFLYEGNCLVHIAMRKKEIPHEFRIRDGIHGWAYWQAALPEVFKFLTKSFNKL